MEEVQMPGDSEAPCVATAGPHSITPYHYNIIFFFTQPQAYVKLVE